MKKETKLKILRILFVISLIISILLISNTYAKYQEKVDTNYKIGIKRWKIIVNEKVIREQESLTEVVQPSLIDHDYVRDNVIVPGRECFFDMQIDYSQVDVPFTVDVSMEQLNTNPLLDFEFYGFSFDDGDIVQFHDIPAEYQQVEYIESTGTQYIDTGLRFSAESTKSYTMETNIKYTTTTAARQLQGAQGLVFGINESGLYETSFASTVPYSTDKFDKVVFTSVSANDKLQRTLNVNNVKVAEGELNKSDFTAFANSKVLLFASGILEGAANYSTAKIKDFKIYEDNTLIRYYVPCYRIEDNVIGMYDLVTDTFYTNSGTGTFTKGNNVEKILIDPTEDVSEENTNTVTNTTGGTTVTNEKVKNLKLYYRWNDEFDNQMDNLADTIFTGDLDEETGENVVKYKATIQFEQYVED